MIKSFVFSEGKLVGQDMDAYALKLVRADKGLHIWVDLFAPTPEESRLILEEVFNFHPLAIEDCLAMSHLPKIEDYEEYLFMVMHAVDFSRKEKFHASELDFFLGKEFLVTHHTVPLRSIQVAMDRVLKNSISVARAPDRLMHTLLDVMVDNYQPVSAELSKEIQELEDEIFSSERKWSNQEVMTEFLAIKKEVASLRQISRPQRELMYLLARGEQKLIRPHLLPYYRDVYDHLLRIEETANSFTDQLLLAMDVYLNKASNETNGVIKILTILTAITTPTILIGTWYGMNFKGMPELDYPLGYPLSFVINVLMTCGLLIWLKKWL